MSLDAQSAVPEPGRNSHGAAWVIASLVAVLLYFGSVPPLGVVLDPNKGRSPFDDPWDPYPMWFYYYTAPYVLVREHTVLGKPLNVYMEWCRGVTR